MKLSVDKLIIREGEVVAITWDSNNAQTTRLIIDNGYKSSALDVPSSGEKKIRLNRSKGLTKVILSALVNGKQKNKVTLIKVRSPKTVKPKEEKHYDSYKRMDNTGFRGWWQRFCEKLRAFGSKLRYFWKSLTPQKRQSYILLLFVCVLMGVTNYYPALASLGLGLMGAYLIISLLR